MKSSTAMGKRATGKISEMPKDVTSSRDPSGSGRMPVPVQKREYLSAWTIVALILLMPVISTAIQLPLTPSHGSTPAMEYHQLMFQSCLLLYFAWRMIYKGPTLVSFATQASMVPVLAAWIPFIQLHLAFTAQYLGPVYSAVLIKAVTWLPLQGLLVNIIRLSIERSVPNAEFLVGLGAMAFYFGVDHAWESYQAYAVSFAYGLVRPYLMLLVSLLLMALVPTRWLVGALIPSLHTVFWNPHSPATLSTRRLNDVLGRQGFSIIQRTEGLTGYLSVIENSQEGYRLLRCDHSVLGGNWVSGLGTWAGGKDPATAVGRLAEPIYAVFVMLEAVRLVQDKTSAITPVADSEAKALNIGLGIGTTPSAFIAHGIDTTIVELDPIVHRLATEYFDLPSNHTAVLQDALVFVENELASTTPTLYDYIVHDVFTGGAEPTALFTFEFLFNLKQLLKEDGVIALNYASDLDLPSTKLVLNTIIAVFPNCRLYRDVAEEDGAVGHVNFVNMVLFCRKNERPFLFREPVDSDFLGTMSRRTLLMPKLEIDIGKYVPRGPDGRFQANETKLLHAGRTEDLEKWHGLAAGRHWQVMRTVVPDQVWELW